MGDDREHTLEFGLPPEREEAMGYLESTDRYEAIEEALAGLTACINGTIVYNAIREGIAVDVTGDLTSEERAAVREYPKRSPVYTLVTLDRPNSPTVEIRSPA